MSIAAMKHHNCPSCTCTDPVLPVTEWEITITIDTNDADYMTTVNTIMVDELDIILPLIEAIKNFKPYKSRSSSGLEWDNRNNYPYNECLREDLGQKSPQDYYGFSKEIHEMFEELCPYNEYGFHTVETVTIGSVSEKITLL